MAKLSILIYHRVLNRADPFRLGEVDRVNFNAQMRWISRFYNVIDLNEGIHLLKEGGLPPRALSITFDDGYRDNVTNALPILKAHNLTATFFISTGFLDGGIMWNDIVIEAIKNTSDNVLDLTEFGLKNYNISDANESIVNQVLGDIKYLSLRERSIVVENLPNMLSVCSPHNLMMNDKDVQDLSSEGMAIGGHTVNHPILSMLTTSEAKTEILKGKHYLENLLQEPMNIFAYPNGKPNQDYSYEHVKMLKDLGFTGAVSTAWGVATPNSDIFQLPRFTPWDKNKCKFLLRLLMKRFSEREEMARVSGSVS